MKAELKADISSVKADISDVKAELKADISSVKADMKADISNVKADISDVKADMKSDLAQAKKDLLREIDVLHSYMLAGGMRSHAERISPDQGNGETRPEKDETAPQTTSPQPARKAHATR